MEFLGEAINFLRIIDLILVLFVLYYLFKILKGAKGIFFLNAILILFIINLLSRSLGLEYFNVLLEQIMLMLFVALPIIFQNELKRALEVLGQKNPILQADQTTWDSHRKYWNRRWSRRKPFQT